MNVLPVLPSGGLGWMLQSGQSGRQTRRGKSAATIGHRRQSDACAHGRTALQLTFLCGFRRTPAAPLLNVCSSFVFSLSLSLPRVIFLRGDASAQSLGNVRPHYPASQPPFVCKSLIVCRSFVPDNEAFCPPCFCRRSSLSCDSVPRPAIHHV